MKREGDVWAKFISKENIKKAIINAAKGKRRYRKVRKVLNNIDEYVDKLYELLTPVCSIALCHFNIKDRVRKRKGNIQVTLLPGQSSATRREPVPTSTMDESNDERHIRLYQGQRHQLQQCTLQPQQEGEASNRESEIPALHALLLEDGHKEMLSER